MVLLESISIIIIGRNCMNTLRPQVDRMYDEKLT